MDIGPVAQWIERPPPKRQVGRSIRPRIIGKTVAPFYLEFRFAEPQKLLFGDFLAAVV